MKKGLYRGFSSYEYQRAKTFKVTDIELVKLDLLNHIFTRKGERVMMPTFGTQIPDLMFDPLDDITISIIQDELQTVFDFDPRVEPLEIAVTPDFDNNTIVASARLRYIELDMEDTLYINLVFEGV